MWAIHRESPKAALTKALEFLEQCRLLQNPGCLGLFFSDFGNAVSRRCRGKLICRAEACLPSLERCGGVVAQKKQMGRRRLGWMKSTMMKSKNQHEGARTGPCWERCGPFWIFGVDMPVGKRTLANPTDRARTTEGTTEQAMEVET